MTEILEYIESYFEGNLTIDERTQFEQRITTDAAFASEVAFYLQARQALRQEIVEQKGKSWEATSATDAITPPKQAPVIPLKKPSFVRRWMVAAAIIIVAVGTYLLTFLMSSPGGAAKMAQQYSDSAFGQLSHLMDASQDSLQQGITAYNAGNWQEAEKLFDAVYAAHPTTLEALKYSGVVAIKKKNYDKAIKQFEKLAATPDLFANPGLFYQAIALLLRNKSDDKKQAAILLQQVVNKNLFGSAKAAEMLQQINQ